MPRRWRRPLSRANHATGPMTLQRGKAPCHSEHHDAHRLETSPLAVTSLAIGFWARAGQGIDEIPWAT
jgi:hypothetical protein